MILASQLGVTLVGINEETGLKALYSVALIVGVVLLRMLALGAIRRILGGEVADPRRFWARQGVQVVAAIVTVLGLLSIWVTPDTDVSTGIGLISAGLAFALQQVILSLAAYFVILRGDVFGVGDRITLGGVRGDVIQLGFLKTTIMEMGQPPAVNAADPAVWVHSRQYTGRLVTVTNGAIFQEPVYNYTREFPYIWEEIAIPLSYATDPDRVERLLLDVAARHTRGIQTMSDGDRAELARRYLVQSTDTAPRVFCRLTDNWLEMTVRFVAREHGVRELKDAMSRDILHGLQEAGIPIASATFAVVGVPPITVELAAQRATARR